MINEFVQVEIEGRPVTSAYKIPRTAMRENQQVWLADTEDQLVIKPVTVVWQDDTNVYVTDGLSPGDRLIESAIATPVDNMKLRVSGSDATATTPQTKPPKQRLQPRWPPHESS